MFMRLTYPFLVLICLDSVLCSAPAPLSLLHGFQLNELIQRPYPAELYAGIADALAPHHSMLTREAKVRFLPLEVVTDELRLRLEQPPPTWPTYEEQVKTNLRFTEFVLGQPEEVAKRIVYSDKSLREVNLAITAIGGTGHFVEPLIKALKSEIVLSLRFARSYDRFVRGIRIFKALSTPAFSSGSGSVVFWHSDKLSPPVLEALDFYEKILVHGVTPASLSDLLNFVYAVKPVAVVEKKVLTRLAAHLEAQLHGPVHLKLRPEEAVILAQGFRHGTISANVAQFIKDIRAITNGPNDPFMTSKLHAILAVYREIYNSKYLCVLAHELAQAFPQISEFANQLAVEDVHDAS